MIRTTRPTIKHQRRSPGSVKSKGAKKQEEEIISNILLFDILMYSIIQKEINISTI